MRPTFLICALFCQIAWPARSAESGQTRDTIERLTSIFENSTPKLQYTYCQNIHDRRGYTFGFAGFTSGTYDGTLFLEEYDRLRPGNSLARFLPAFEKIDAGPHDNQGRNPSIVGLEGFPAAFRACGGLTATSKTSGDPAFIQAQQNLAGELYWNPSQRIARRIGARLPLTRGELYDACINLGEDGLQNLVRRANRALGGTPKGGIDERAWIAKFLDLRLADLLGGDRTERRSTDRVRVYQRLLAQGNVQLQLPLSFTCYGDHFTLKQGKHPGSAWPKEVARPEEISHRGGNPLSALKKIALSLALATVFPGLSFADEDAPPVFGRSIFISGQVSHSRTADGVLASGIKTPEVFAEEIHAPAFTAIVEGLPEGTYTTVIDLAETDVNAPGQRVMRISAGDKVLAEKVDIFEAAGGKGKPYQLKLKVDHEADQIRGPLSITFTGVTQEAKLNGIQILNAAGKPVAGAKAKDLRPTAGLAARKIPDIQTPPIYGDPGQPMDARIDDLISRMSLAEKAGQVVSKASAIERLEVPAYNYWSEALHGVGRNGRATVFPQAIGLAATWDEALIHQIGEVIATEGRAKYYETIRDGKIGRENAGLNFWAPNVNIFRDPRWGRGQETYGEDPFLTGRIGVNYVEGVQVTDPKYPGYLKAMATAKHFAVHSGPEKGRGHFNVDPTTRDLRETYLPQFQMIVQEAKVQGIMAAYNSIYGVPCAADHWLLTDLLRDEWGFQGHVVSDCGAVSQIAGEKHYVPTGEEGSAASIKSGLDLECGGSFANLTSAVAKGLITEKEIDAALHRVLEIRFRLGLFDPPDKAPFSGVPASEIESPAHLQLALEAARQSMTLLKNSGILPLDKTKLKRIAVIGPNATSRAMLIGNYHGEPSKPVTVLDGIKAAAGDGAQVDFVQGCDLILRPDVPPHDPKDFQKAVDIAKNADVVIYVGGLDADVEGEEMPLEAPGFDRGDRTVIELPEPQTKMIKALHGTGKPVIFVNCSGSSIAMPWEAKNLPAILQAWFPGGEGGAAVADVLFGNTNPAGRLPVTFYAKTEDLPPFSDYRMANRTYRYFTGKPLFPFGHGLSYTSFRYQPAQPATATLPANGTLKIRVPVQNSGARDGDEVVQVYLKHKNSPVPQPIHSLIAFQRVPIAKGATANVDLEIPVERFHYWDIAKNAYVVDPGAYEVQIGASSQDIRQTCAVTVTR